MQERIWRASTAITPKLIENAKQSHYRIHKCIEVNDNHFEHLL